MLALERGAVEESGVYTCKWEVTEGAPTAILNVRVMGEFILTFFVVTLLTLYNKLRASHVSLILQL